MTAPRQAEVSEREAEVLAAVGAGLTNAQIARRLFISVRTAEGHVSSLLRKYAVADRRALAEIALAATVARAGQIAGLPQSRTTFVGRVEERDAILDAMERGQQVTLVGPGGVGKTRLAAAVANAAAPAFPFGGAFVDLVPVRAGLLAQAVAAALGVTERAQQPLEEAVIERLSRGRSLLVLDNCEHLVDAAADFVERVLAACQDTTILATSRERLGVPGERTFPVAPLPLGSDAERLFHDRASAAWGRGSQLPTREGADAVLDPRTVSDLCARLDGLPLAIELAAARSASLGPTGLLTGLGDYLRLLAGGRGPVVRHRSLRGVIGWSHDLLDEEEQALFRRLAVFVGSFDLPAAVAVTGGDAAVVADVLGRLVDKSLVTHRRDATGSWRLLDTIRAFAGERLDGSDERPGVRERHLRWAAARAEELEGRLGGEWRHHFDAVVNDLRAALAAAEQPGQVSHQLARSLGHLTFARRFLMESLGHYQRAARLAPTPAEAARDLSSAADCAQVVNDSGRAFDLQVAAAGYAGAAGDGNARAVALARAVEIAGRYPATFRDEVPHERLRQLLAEATAAGDPADLTVAARLAGAAAWSANSEKLTPDPALAVVAVEAARATGDPILISAGLDAVRTAAITDGRVRDAHTITSQRLTLLDRMDPADPHQAPEIDDTLGLACSDAVAAGDLPAARSAARLIQNDEIHGDHPYLTASKVIPAYVLSGDLELTVGFAATMWEGWQRAGRPPAFWMQPAAHFVVLAHGLRGDSENVARWRARAEEVAGVSSPLRPRLTPLTAFVDARIAIHSGDPGHALALVERAETHVPQGRYLSYARAAAAELAVVAGLPDAAARLDSAKPVAAENDWAAACLARAAGRLNADAGALATSVELWERAGARVERACTLLLVPDRAAEGRAELAATGVPVPP